ncbi:MAG: YbjN domain-containing protein [Spirochaetia bacterium]
MDGAVPVKSKIESYLINLSLTYEEAGDDVWVINDGDKGLANVVIFAEDPLVTIRTKVMTLPEKDRSVFFEELLRLNADMVYGAYAIDDSDVVLVETFELSTLDYEEFQGALDAIGLALAQHYPRLSKFRDQ